MLAIPNKHHIDYTGPLFVWVMVPNCYIVRLKTGNMRVYALVIIALENYVLNF